MVANTRTVGASGKNHTTIASAVSWFQANHNFDTDGIGTILIEDSAEFNERIVVDGISGTPSISAYLKITTALANRHTGAAGTGHARVKDTVGDRAFDIYTSFTMVEGLEIQSDTGGGSDEAIRIRPNVFDVLITSSVLWTARSVSQQDGIYSGNWAMSAYVDNCIIYGWHRAGINMQNYSGDTTQNWYIDHVTVYNCGGELSAGSGGIKIGSRFDEQIVFANVYNTVSVESPEDFSNRTAGQGTNNWTGTHNADSDGSLSDLDVEIATNAQQNLVATDVSQSSGSFAVFKNLTAGSEDLTLLDDAGGNRLSGTGVSRAGSEPDPRQDFTIDIVGNLRNLTAPNIGAFEFVPVASIQTPINPSITNLLATSARLNWEQG